MEALFYIHAFVAVVAMGMAMVISHTIHALLCMIISLLCIAVTMYIYLAPLAAALEVIVYAGAIMVLFIFVIMLLQMPKKVADEKSNSFYIWKKNGLALLAFALFWGELTFVLSGDRSSSILEGSTIKEIAMALFGAHGFLLEVTSFLLLAGLATAVFLGKTLMESKKRLGE